MKQKEMRTKGTQMQTFSQETQKATALFKRLSPEERKMIIALLRSLSSTKE